MNENETSYILENKGDLIFQLKYWRHIVWLFLKNKVLLVLVVVYFFPMSSSETELILMGCREYLSISVCIWYDEASFTSIGKGTLNYLLCDLAL